MKTSLTSLFLAALIGLAPATLSAVAPSPPERDRFRLIFEAEWNDIACVDYPLTPERWVQECIASLANTQVDTLIYNLCSSDSYVAQLNNGELMISAFEKVPDAWVWRYRENTRRLIAAGGNPPQLAVEAARRLDLLAIPMVRMNDPHDQYFQYEVSHFKLANPQFLIGSTGPGWKPDWEKGYKGRADKKGMAAFTWGLFDYAHKEVREHKLAIIDEFITRWDNDGVGLDFDRDPVLFKEEGKPENAELLTAMLRHIRATLDRVAKERGRRQYLYVRVIPDMDVCVARGMDVRTWVKEGLVDVITPGAGYLTVGLDVKPWLDLVATGPRTCRIVVSSNHYKPSEEARAWTKLMRQRGAYGVQLFNFGHLLYGFGRDADPEAQVERQGTVWFSELHPDYYQTLNELNDLKLFAFKDSRYRYESVGRDFVDGDAQITHRKYRGIDSIVLPAVLTQGSHSVPFGFAEDLPGAHALGFRPRVTFQFTVTDPANIGKYELMLNGHRLDVAGGQAEFKLDVPPEWMKQGQNELVANVLDPVPGKPAKLSGLVVEVHYLNTPKTKTVVLGPEAIMVDDVKVPGPLVVGQHASSFQLKKETLEALKSTPQRMPSLRLRIDNYTFYDNFDVRLNGQVLPVETRHARATFIMRNDSWLEYPITPDQLREGANEVQFEVKSLNPQISKPPSLMTIQLARN